MRTGDRERYKTMAKHADRSKKTTPPNSGRTPKHSKDKIPTQQFPRHKEAQDRSEKK